MYRVDNDIRVYIVWGSPGSGKTTYVKNNMDKGDMVVDLDLIKQSISMASKTNATDNLLNTALSIQEHLYNLIEYREVIRCNNIWVVAGLPNAIDREYLKNRLRAELIQIKATKEECIDRAMKDDEREDKELQMRIIDKWFANFTT